MDQKPEWKEIVKLERVEAGKRRSDHQPFLKLVPEIRKKWREKTGLSAGVHKILRFCHVIKRSNECPNRKSILNLARRAFSERLKGIKLLFVQYLLSTWIDMLKTHPFLRLNYAHLVCKETK